MLSQAFLLGLLAPALALSPAQRCANLVHTRIKNAHSVKTQYLRAGESYRIPASCGVGLGEDLRAQTPVNACVVNVVYNTSRIGATRVEAWMPDSDAWYGRILAAGAGGLAGCVEYDCLKWGTSLHFAAVSHDGGHDGPSGEAFLQGDDLVADYAYRGLHVSAQVLKTLVRAYYGRPHTKAYYVGCSAGGRNGLRSVQDYPADFDGVLAGAPGVNFVRFIGQSAIANLASHALDEADWALVREELLRQCDGLDGLRDGNIDDPDACQFVPEALLCEGAKGDGCLSVEQVDAVRKIHSPLYGTNGELLSPRIDPGAINDLATFPVAFAPTFYEVALQWWRYVVYRNATWQPSPNFGLKEIADAEKADAKVRVSSWSPDISAFRKRGGKLLVYHGSRDLIIPSGTAKWYYQRVARELSLPISKMDEFYRLFMIPGMDHCGGGPGAWQFGQSIQTSWSNSSDASALLALVDWVEKDMAPATLKGSTGDARTRLHCSYPTRSVWEADKQDWVCEQAP
ncbi:tannase and feruloyl esterase [Auricularia subglabra TFB-10046 SS5]|nr:tannase and feruloyl esterase [Auricularia subglabra TFB-10046 SS5]